MHLPFLKHTFTHTVDYIIAKMAATSDFESFTVNHIRHIYAYGGGASESGFATVSMPL